MLWWEPGKGFPSIEYVYDTSYGIYDLTCLVYLLQTKIFVPVAHSDRGIVRADTHGGLDLQKLSLSESMARESMARVLPHHKFVCFHGNSSGPRSGIPVLLVSFQVCSSREGTADLHNFQAFSR